MDSIQEFKIQKSQYPAEFGGKASALINVATRAGTNVFVAASSSSCATTGSTRTIISTRKTSRCRRCARISSAARSAVRWPGSELLLRQLRRAADAPIADANVLGADARRERQLLGARPDLRSAAVSPATGTCTPFAGNQIPAEPHRSARGRVPPARAAADLGCGAAEPDVDRAAGQGHQSVERPDRSTASATAIRSSRDSAPSTRTSSSRSARAALQETLVPGFGRYVDTKARNLGVSHTHLFGALDDERAQVRLDAVTGGQTSENRGVDFARRSDSRASRRDPRDVGYPQISTRGLYSTFGDPTTFVYRGTTSISSSTTACSSIAAPIV